MSEQNEVLGRDPLVSESSYVSSPIVVETCLSRMTRKSTVTSGTQSIEIQTHSQGVETKLPDRAAAARFGRAPVKGHSNSKPIFFSNGIATVRRLVNRTRDGGQSEIKAGATAEGAFD